MYRLRWKKAKLPEDPTEPREWKEMFRQKLLRLRKAKVQRLVSGQLTPTLLGDLIPVWELRINDNVCAVHRSFHLHSAASILCSTFPTPSQRPSKFSSEKDQNSFQAKKLSELTLSLQSNFLGSGMIPVVRCKTHHSQWEPVYQNDTVSVFRVAVEGGALLLGVWEHEGGSLSNKEMAFLIGSFSVVQILRSLTSSIMGSPFPPIPSLKLDPLDSRWGLHDFSVHLTIRSTGKVFWDNSFHKVFFDRTQLAADPFAVASLLSNSFQHAFSGELGITWQSELFTQTIPQMVFLDGVVYSEGNHVVWTFSFPLSFVPMDCLPNYDFPEDVESFRLCHEDACGKVEAVLAFSPQATRTFITQLFFGLRFSHINSFFGTRYSPQDL